MRLAVFLGLGNTGTVSGFFQMGWGGGKKEEQEEARNTVLSLGRDHLPRCLVLFLLDKFSPSPERLHDSSGFSEA